MCVCDSIERRRQVWWSVDLVVAHRLTALVVFAQSCEKDILVCISSSSSSLIHIIHNAATQHTHIPFTTPTDAETRDTMTTSLVLTTTSSSRAPIITLPTSNRNVWSGRSFSQSQDARPVESETRLSSSPNNIRIYRVSSDFLHSRIDVDSLHKWCVLFAYCVCVCMVWIIAHKIECKLYNWKSISNNKTTFTAYKKSPLHKPLSQIPKHKYWYTNWIVVFGLIPTHKCFDLSVRWTVETIVVG